MKHTLPTTTDLGRPGDARRDRYMFRLSGDLCAGDALQLKQKLRSFTQPEHIVVDLSDVVKTDLVAINALAMAHRQHQLRVVLPICPEASKLFHLTKFTSILNLVTVSSIIAENIGHVSAYALPQ